MADIVTPKLVPKPTFTGLRYLAEGDIWSILIDYSYNEVIFNVLVSGKEEELPAGYDLNNSIEGKILINLNTLSCGEETPETEAESEQLEDELAKLIGTACISLMEELAQHGAVPKHQTLMDRIYPTTQALQVLTEDNTLVCKKLDNYQTPSKHPPIPVAQLQEIGLRNDIPVLDASQITLISRLQSLVWKVEVNGEVMICKVSIDIFHGALADELATYQKIKTAELKLKVPQLKGVVQSHTGIIAILLSYIPHKHHSLRTLLQDIEHSTVLEEEPFILMKRKWAIQIQETLIELHKIGILWRDVKTDNVLINENNDAFLLDFGGGNTAGWIDRDKYGTMEGEMQGLGKILHILREA